MTKSKEVYDKAVESGMVEEKSYIKFKNTGKHIIKFISDKVINGTNFKTHQPEEKMVYEFEEDGIKKNYETALFSIDDDGKKKLSSFVRNIAPFEYGDVLIAEYKSIPGTPRGYIDIIKDGEDNNDIPVIEEGEHTPYDDGELGESVL